MCPRKTVYVYHLILYIGYVLLKRDRAQGAFTPDANEALRANDLHVKSMQRRDRQSCGAIRVNEAAQMARFPQCELSVWGAS